MVDCCRDGLPYFLMRRVMIEARKECRDSLLREKGVPVGIEKMSKSSLKVECEKRALSTRGTLVELEGCLLACVDVQSQ